MRATRATRWRPRAFHLRSAASRAPELDEHGWPAERLGEGDGALQAYGYRVCLTHGDERLPFEPPEGYDEREFELLRRYLDATGDGRPLGLVHDLLPNAK